VFAIVFVVFVAACASADRVVLAPSGRIVLPGDGSAAYLWQASGGARHGWLTIGIPKDDLGLEVEIERTEARTRAVETLSLQYSVIGEAFTNNMAPSVSVGLRDMPNRGPDGRAAYLSLSKTIGLSESQERILSAVRVHAGYGTDWMGGAYVGASATVLRRADLAAELLARRFNAGLSIRLIGPVSALAHTRNGAGFVGIAVRATR
jgi:hypothetical protein